MHHLIRQFLFFLFKYKATYYIGMIFLRFLRILKNSTFKEKEEMVLVKNYMGNVKMMVNKNSSMGGAIFWFGFHHTREMLFLSKFLKSEMTFIDIGANQGEFALFAASVLKNGRVIAFEPTSWQLNLLKNNIALNQFKNVEICEYGLFNEEKQIEVFTSNDSVLHKGHHEGLSTIYRSDSRNISEGIIELKIFDEIHFDNLERFDVLKIDIEGAELPALKGMSKSLLKFKPLIIIEMSEANYNLAGYGINDVIEFLSQFGYQPYRFHRNEIRPLNSYSKSGSDNIVYIASK